MPYIPTEEYFPPPVRHAYQKVKIGDIVGWRTFSSAEGRYTVAFGKVTEKGKLGAIYVLLGRDGTGARAQLYGTDVLGIERI